MPSKLMVCIPQFDHTVKGACAESVGNAIDHAESAGLLDSVTHRYPRGYGIARARNYMAQWAIEAGCDHVLMVDSDIVLPRAAISDLLSDDLEVALGYYVRGSSEDGTTNVVKLESGGYANSYKAHELSSMREPVRVKAGGFGCAMVNVDVFRRFKRPWFVYHDFADGSGLSEDYDFCNKCRSSGVSVWVDPRVGCGHIHDRVLEVTKWQR